ncbi:MAG: hypothetical protein ACJ8F3_06585 [Xanthobacteraceae bacterium]
MRTLKLTFATALLALATASGANALPLSGASGLLAAVGESSVAQQVHCVPGWVHRHPWGFGTGCGYGRAVPLYRGRVYGRPVYRGRAYAGRGYVGGRAYVGGRGHVGGRSVGGRSFAGGGGRGGRR